MNRRACVFAILSSLLFTAAVILSTVYGEIIPPVLLYSCIIGLYVIGIIHTAWRPDGYALFTLVLSAFLPMFLVLGPVEPGLYGNDPYAIVGYAENFRDLPIPTHTGRYNTRPALYALLFVLIEILGAGVVEVSKYLPLVNVVVPLSAFLIFRHLVSTRGGLLVGFGVAGARSMFLFQSKFVLQALAFPLFLILVFLLIHNRDSFEDNNWDYLTITPLAIAIPFTHKVTSVMLVFFLATWFIAPIVASPLGVERTRVSGLTTVSAISVGAVLLVFLEWDPETFASLLLSVLGVAEVGGLPTSVTRSLSTIEAIAIYGNLTLLSVLCLVNAGVLWPEKRHEWSISFVGYNAIIMGLYGIQLLIGDLTGLHTTRFPLFAVPFLIGIAAFVLFEEDRDGNGVSLRNAATYGLVVLFIGVQVSSVPFHVLAADGEQPLGESHYYEDSRAAVDWVNGHSQATIIGYERDLWWFYGDLDFRHGLEGPCQAGELMVEWDGADLASGNSKGAVYDNGLIRLKPCNSLPAE